MFMLCMSGVASYTFVHVDCIVSTGSVGWVGASTHAPGAWHHLHLIAHTTIMSTVSSLYQTACLWRLLGARKRGSTRLVRKPRRSPAPPGAAQCVGTERPVTGPQRSPARQ